MDYILIRTIATVQLEETLLKYTTNNTTTVPAIMFIHVESCISTIYFLATKSIGIGWQRGYIYELSLRLEAAIYHK